MQKKLFNVLLALVVLLSCQGFGDQIGFNISGNDSADRLAGETADGCSLWTDVYGSDENAISSGTGLVLDGTGGLVTVDWASSNLWQSGPNGTSDQQIYHKWLDDGNPVIVTFNGLGNWLAASGYGGAYTIRIYQNTDWGNNNFPSIDITDGINVLETVQATNFDYSDGTRAFCDSGLLIADSVTLELGPRDLTANARSPFSAAKITLFDKLNPINPDPVVDGVQVTTSQVISWEQLPLASGLGVTYDVYFGTDPNTEHPTYYGLTPVRTTTDNPADFNYTPTLVGGTTYYWKVDAIDPNNGSPTVFSGAEWSFMTLPDAAKILTHPVSQIVSLGTTEVQFSVTASNATIYQWYKDGVALQDDLTNTLYVGEDSAMLTIYDTQVVDDGDYHCVVDNSLQQPDASYAALLMTQRQIGWWKLDGDLTDSINDLYPDALAHDGSAVDPNYVIGIDNSAVQLSDLDDVITCSNSSDFFSSFVNGFTVSAWVNMPFKNGSWESFVSMEGIYEDESRSGYIMSINGIGQPIYTLRQSFGDINAFTDIDDGIWHLMVCTYDAATKTGKLYIDGTLRNQATNSDVLIPSPADLIFGVQNADSTTVYNGLLDDVRIWNHELETVDVAKLYTDFNPGSEICLGNLEFDVAGPGGIGNEFRDCKVDIYDFAVFLQGWLECNLVPTCLP